MPDRRFGPLGHRSRRLVQEVMDELATWREGVLWEPFVEAVQARMAAADDRAAPPYHAYDRVLNDLIRFGAVDRYRPVHGPARGVGARAIRLTVLGRAWWQGEAMPPPYRADLDDDDPDDEEEGE